MTDRPLREPSRWGASRATCDGPRAPLRERSGLLRRGTHGAPRRNLRTAERGSRGRRALGVLAATLTVAFLGMSLDVDLTGRSTIGRDGTRTAPGQPVVVRAQSDLLPERYELDDVWRSRRPPSPYERIEHPVDVATDGPHIYVLAGAPQERQIRRYDASGRPVGVWPAPGRIGTPRAIAAAGGRIAIVAEDGGLLMDAGGRSVARWQHAGGRAVAFAADGRRVITVLRGRDGRTVLDVRDASGRLLETWRDPLIAIREPASVTVDPSGNAWVAADGAIYRWSDGAVVDIVRVGELEGPALIDVTIDGDGLLLGVLASAGMGGPPRLLAWQVDPDGTQLIDRTPIPGLRAIELGPSPDGSADAARGLVGVRVAENDAHVPGMLFWLDRADLSTSPTGWVPPPEVVGQLVAPRTVAGTEGNRVYIGDVDVVHTWSTDGTPIDAWPVAGIRDVAPLQRGGGTPCVLTAAGLRCWESDGGSRPAGPPDPGWIPAIGAGPSWLAIPDIGHQRVSLMRPDGNAADAWRFAPDGDFLAIDDVAVADGGTDIAMVASHSRSVRVHSADGTFLRAMRVGAGAKRVASKDGYWFVLDRTDRVWKLTADGSALATWAVAEHATGHAGDVSALADGRIAITDPDGGAVLLYRRTSGSSEIPDVEDPDACTISVDKSAAPGVVPQGGTITVTLRVDGHCPRGDGAVDAVMVLDTSGSMEGAPLAAAQQAAAAFLGELRPDAARVGLVAFASDARRIAPVQADLAAAARGLGELSAGGMTRLAPALGAAHALFRDAGTRPGIPRVAVVMSDGRPNDAGQVRSAAAELRSGGVTVYTVAFGSDADAALLRQVSGDDGRSLVARDGPALIAAFASLGARASGDALLRQARITDGLPWDMRWAGGARPAPDARDADTVRWIMGEVPTTGATIQYRVRATRAGRRPTNRYATIDYVDSTDRIGRATFPIPFVRVEPRLFLPWLGRSACRPIPADVALTFDTSGSMDQIGMDGVAKLEAARRAGHRFIDALSGTDQRVAVVSFDADARILAPLSGDGMAAREAVDGWRTSPGTRIDRGIEAAMAELGGAEALTRSERTILLLTDGLPSAGTRSAAIAAATAARAADISIITIGIGRTVDGRLLSEIADGPEATARADDAAALERIYGRFANAILCH